MNKKIVVFFVFTLFAKFIIADSEITIKKGHSRSFKTNTLITTVFTSNPSVVDYKILNDNEIIVYANDEGLSNIKIYSVSKLVLDVDIFVNNKEYDLKRIAKLLEEKNPNSLVTIDRLGENGFVLSGFAPDEGTKETIYNMAAVALGLSISKNDQNQNQSPNAPSSNDKGNQQANNNMLEFLEKVKTDNLINKIKVQGKKLVNVKLLVADVEKNFIEKLGIDWNNGGVFRLPALTVLGSTLRTARPADSFLNLNSIVTAIKNDRVAKVLAQPNISVISGEEATFSVTGEYTPFINNIGVNGETVSSPGTAKQYGIGLSIRPKVSSDKKIKLAISQEVSNIQSIVEKGNASAANLKTRKTNTVIELGDGDSFVIGGLLDNSINKNISSTPVLGEIPLVGAMFRKVNITKSKNELIIIATVSLTESSDPEKMEIPTFYSDGVLSSLFNMPLNGVWKNRSEIKNFLNNSGFIFEPIVK